MRTAKRNGMPRYLRKPVVAPPREPARSYDMSVLVRTVAFMPAWQRKRAH